jgi:hyperosmotically inducible periplasmic protein
MLKSKLVLSLAILALPLASLSLQGCTSSYRHESTGQYIDSSVTTTKVKARLLADEDIKSLPITVKTYKSTVQLSGFVDNNFQKYRAVGIASNVPGVTEVQDLLVVKKR